MEVILSFPQFVICNLICDIKLFNILKAGTDYGTYSAAQPDAAAKNMLFASVDSQ